MQFYGRAQETAQQIIEAFRSGNVPQPLAQVFIKRPQVPMSQWSVLNQFSCLLNGCVDARGYQQWRQVGRYVKKGEMAQAAILVPLQKVISEEANGQETERPIVYGFKGVPVFDVSQTEGDPLPEQEAEGDFIDSLPLLAVAQALGLDVKTYRGRYGAAMGIYSPTRRLIALGVENIATWCHELVHAADDTLGNLKERGQHWRSETVAELGGATLALMLGLEVEADLGGCWAYVQQYAQAAGIEPLTACIRVLERTAQAISLILAIAEQVRERAQKEQILS